MSVNYFTYNGRSSLEFGLLILAGTVRFPTPERKIEWVEVPGRDGSLTIDEGAYRDVEKTISCKMQIAYPKTIDEQAKELSEWLHGQVGWGPLWFSSDPDYLYQAICYASYEVEKELAVLGAVELPFTMRPYKYNLEGETARTVTHGDVLFNPEGREAKPMIKIPAGGVRDFRLVINNGVTSRIYTLAGLPNKAVTMDCEREEIYTDSENLSLKMTSYRGQYPTLSPGKNTITFGNSSDTVEIIPKWRAFV